MSTAGAVLTYLALCAAPTLVFGAISAALSPADNRLTRAGGWLYVRVRAMRQRPPLPTEPVVDPFAALEVQVRLGRLATEIAELQTQATGSARRHHRAVALAAYDDLLDEACRLADVRPAAEPGTAGRRRKEAALHSLGWCW